MSHKYSDDRNLIFRAISEGMKGEFTEENYQTNLFSTITWFLKNDSRFIEGCFRDRMRFEMIIEEITTEAVATAYQDIIYIGNQGD